MTKANKKLKSILLPQASRILILPNANVAEIVLSLDLEKKDIKEYWLLGLAKWRGFTIPVISVEALVSKEVDSSDKSLSYIVLYGLNNNERYRYYAISVTGIPRLKFIEEEKVKDLENNKLSEYYIAEIAVDNEKFTVPDLEKIENKIIELHY